ncbi:MAG: hypothetical protein CVU56_09555 [Deltaproteobacteria bacterium HGW-Deltaproteobacteria-14]|nr:MAG: hypothetical protein CVU56_09555 [Deltaproteobacteria bacterium HGW-Deltaproteobacteria-14]
MTTDGGGWTLVSRHFGAVGMQDTAAVGTLSGPTQTSGAKLSDAVINALRPDYDTAVFRFSCSAGAPSYFQQSLAFQATGAGTDALLRCSNAWDAASWYLATQYVSHFGLNNYLQDGNCGVYQIWDYGGSGCYPDGVGTTYVKGPIVGVTPLTGGRVIGDPARWGDGTYAASCNDYLNPGAGYVYFGAIGDGVYAIDPDGDGTPFEAYCDMTADSGGWTLLATLQSTDSGGTANWPSWAAEWWTIPHGSPPDPTVAFSNQDTRLFRPLISPTSIVRASSPAAAVSRYHFNMTQADWDLWDTTRTVAAVRLIGPFGSPTSTLVSTSASLSGAVTAGLNGHWDSGYFYLGTATNGGDTDGEDLGARYHVSTNAPGSFGYVGDVRQSALWHLWLK